MSDLQAAKMAVLNDVFGYDKFREGQERVVDCLLNGESVLAIMPTGAGKSLCFQVPALALGGLSVVISPLVALMEDQVSALKLAGVAAEAINSTRDRDTNVATWRRVAAGDISILYLAPERLMTERMLSALSKLPITLFAIDEAHCMSQWGPAFRPEYAELGKLSEAFPNTPIAALTATADEATRKDVETQLFAGKFSSFISGFDRPNIKLNVSPKASWKDQLLNFVDKRRGESGIIYCLSRKKTEEVAALLRQDGFNALAYHAGLTADDRSDHQNRFVTESGVIMAATIAFGMGIDKPDVRFVFHTDLPGSVEAYYQEIGRAGRDGSPAEAHMLFGAGDIRMRRQFIDQEDSDDDRKWRENKRLDALVQFADSMSCRRQALLAYFGENAEPCGNCDICENPVELTDSSEHALMVFDAIFETGERYGQAHIIDVLRGSKTEKITKARHNSVDCFGVGSGLTKGLWQSLVRQMISTGFLEVDIAGYGGLKMTDKGNALSRGEGKFECRLEEVAVRSKKPKERDKSKASREISDRDQTLLTLLKEKRLELAKAKGVPAYVIFPDKTLEEMAVIRPSTLDDMAAVKGVGTAKLKNFGETFLGVIALD
ncbi:MAG: DNA helicase RecQ [Hyphomicrobiales bacterium]